MKWRLFSLKPVTGAITVAMAAMIFPVEADAPANKQIEPEREAEGVGVAEVPDIATLVKALGDESYLARQASTMSLWSMGSDALPALRQAASGSDPEIVDRASELILYISAGVLFDSPEKVKVLVLNFAKGNLDAKLKILRQLTGLGQWRQVLHLARLEEDDETREKMSSIVRETAVRAARDAIVRGDFDLVSEILQLSGTSDQAMVARAWFLHRQGKLKQELTKADAMPEKKGTLWRLALYRASGNLKAAISEAHKAGRDDLAAAMEVFTGNAQPWLEKNADNSLHDAILNRSCQIQNLRLTGDDRQADVLARELSRLAVNEDNAAGVISGLAANGYAKEVIKLLGRFDVDAAFEYHELTESPQRALEVLGIPKAEKPSYADWAKKFSDQVVEDEDEDLYERILMLAGFLVRHGEAEEAAAVLEPMMTLLEEDGSDIWFDLIGKMASVDPQQPIYELGPQAIQLIEKRGNEDGEADLAVKQLWGGGKSVTHIWEAVKKRNNQNVGKALRDISLLAGLTPDPEQETDAINQALLDDIAQKPVAEQSARQEALFAFAIKRHEIEKASKMVDDFAAANDRWLRTKTFLDASLQRWKKVEPAYAAHEKKVPGDYHNLTKWSICLRKLGRKQKAEEVLDQALLLSMGNVPILHRIAEELAYAGYGEEAYVLSLQAGMMSDPDAPDYGASIIKLVRFYQPHTRHTTWKKAAAIAEVYSRFSMLGGSNDRVIGVLNARFNADFFRGMDLLENGKRQQALKLLDACQRLIPGSGSLADDFFPALRHAGIDQQYKEWFEHSYQHILASCKLYPKAHNTHNTAAWLASRAVLRLDDALDHAQTAVTLRPAQGAYLDTMAEVWFAKGDRKKAMEWSEKAIAASISHAQGTPRSEGRVLSSFNELNKQWERFKNDPLPTAKRK